MPPQTPATPEAKQLETALFELKRVIVGQDRAIERLFVCLLAQGHCLLEGVPGLAKTLAMETLARVSGGTFTRIQFTPDLLPADIVGTRIYRASSERFDVELGPVFANFVLADEVNRAPAKVQSALLEVMAERHVSIGGRTFGVPEPFLVLATQNPVEQEGVYPLPEAQRDRFLMKVNVGYPTPAEEVEIVNRMGVNPPVPGQVLEPQDVLALQQAARAVYVDRGVVDYAVSLVLATRNPADFGLPELTDFLDYGASPRASLGLVAGARALALLRGRRYALPQDVFDVAPEVLRHRLVLSYEAVAQGLHVDQISARILSTVPAPRVAPSQDAAYRGMGGQPAAAEPYGTQPYGTQPYPSQPYAPEPYAAGGDWSGAGQAWGAQQAGGLQPGAYRPVGVHEPTAPQPAASPGAVSPPGAGFDPAPPATGYEPVTAGPAAAPPVRTITVDETAAWAPADTRPDPAERGRATLLPAPPAIPSASPVPPASAIPAGSTPPPLSLSRPIDQPPVRDVSEADRPTVPPLVPPLVAPPTTPGAPAATDPTPTDPGRQATTAPTGGDPARRDDLPAVAGDLDAAAGER